MRRGRFSEPGEGLAMYTALPRRSYCLWQRDRGFTQPGQKSPGNICPPPSPPPSPPSWDEPEGKPEDVGSSSASQGEGRGRRVQRRSAGQAEDIQDQAWETEGKLILKYLPAMRRFHSENDFTYSGPRPRKKGVKTPIIWAFCTFYFMKRVSR